MAEKRETMEYVRSCDRAARQEVTVTYDGKCVRPVDLIRPVDDLCFDKLRDGIAKLRFAKKIKSPVSAKRHA